MCGISGFFLNFKVDEKLLKKITQTIYHRGPDSMGFWFSEDDGVYMGHTRLSILDLSDKGNQPMKSICGRYIISFNGEIYNFKARAKELKKKFGIRFENGTDTIVLLELISRYGLEKALSLIEGMFAFALWDTKKKKLYFARDRFGEKPLFYYKDENKLIFGSELKVIKSMDIIDLKISQKAAFYYSVLGYIPAPFTIYKNVFKVLPSEIIETNQNYLTKKKKYFSLSFNESSEKIDYKSAKDNIKKSLEASVKKMMVADVEVGCFLSGGVDSSLVSLLMQKNSKKKIRTFTVGFDEKEYDESSYAKEIADSIGTNHHQISVNSNDMFEQIESMINIFDEPFADSSFIPTYLISKLASSHVKVVLSGDGGDEMFLGYNRYSFAKKILYLKRKSPESLRLFLSKMLKGIPSNFFDILSQPFQKMLGIHGFSHKIQKVSNILSFDCNSDFYLKLNTLDNDVLKNESLKENNLFDTFEDLSLLSSIQANDIKFYLPNDILVKVDRSSMFNSLEVRSPFLDHLLVQDSFKLPQEFKLKNNTTKYILKDILSDYTNEDFPYRPKMGFAIPIEKWIKSKKFEKKGTEIFYESDWEKLGFASKDIKKKWELFKKYKSTTPQCIWMYIVAGMWLRNN